MNGSSAWALKGLGSLPTLKIPQTRTKSCFGKSGFVNSAAWWERLVPGNAAVWRQTSFCWWQEKPARQLLRNRPETFDTHLELRFTPKLDLTCTEVLFLPLRGRTCRTRLWLIFLLRARLPLQRLLVLLLELFLQPWHLSLLWFPFWGALEEAVVGRTSLWAPQGAQIPAPPVEEKWCIAHVHSLFQHVSVQSKRVSVQNKAFANQREWFKKLTVEVAAAWFSFSDYLATEKENVRG